MEYLYKISNNIFSGNIDVFTTLVELEDTHNEADEICFDLRGLKDLNPFNMMLIARKINQFKSKFPNRQYTFIRKDTDDYLGHMGFYDAMGANKYGKKMGEAKGSATYIPIHSIDFSSMYFYNDIEPLSQKLAAVLKFDSDLADFIQYAFIESIRNVYEHSCSNKAFVCAQRWPSHNLVEIAVLDEGCGIAHAMKKRYPELSEKALLNLSLNPGISAMSNHRYLGRNDQWSNSGYGLYILKELCKAYGGSFIICSNNYGMHYHNGKRTTYETSFSGTAVSLRFLTNQNINFVQERKRILYEGQEIAKKYKNAITKASKSSGGHYGKSDEW